MFCSYFWHYRGIGLVSGLGQEIEDQGPVPHELDPFSHMLSSLPGVCEAGLPMEALGLRAQNIFSVMFPNQADS